MADATNEMTMNAQGHWPAMLRMAAAWSQTQGVPTTHAMVDLLRHNALTADTAAVAHAPRKQGTPAVAARMP